MLHELKSDKFERVRSLFEGFDYSLSIHAAIEGNNPGRIFVDNVNDPSTAIALTVEGYLLAGEYNNPETNESLRNFFKEKIFTGEIFVNGDWSLSLAVHPAMWEAKLAELIPTYEAVKCERYHYLCREVKFNWHKQLPDRYTVRRVDQSLMDDPEILFPEELKNFMNFEEEWWTKENFLSKGISFVILCDREVVSWCISDCIAGDRIDIGVITHPAYRRQGLATIVVAATVEACLSQGFSAIGWHCNVDNIGSWKTAEKVGFERNREYVYYYYVYDPIDHLAELGWYYYRHKEYAKTVQYYEQVFAFRDDNPDYYYHLMASALALLKNSEKALIYLQAAADHGWRHAAYTKGQEEFNILHHNPEWEAILSQMQENSRIKH